ncbi:MAG: methyltransferase domain-containing protein [Bacteroidales bacterium]|nr:methyltransferase domain-containing protein [Bacteroidales bacterium]
MDYENMEVLRSRLSRYDAGKILDVATGRGEFLHFGLRAFRTFISAAGLDVNNDSLAAAREIFGNIPVILVTGSALSMPFPERVFDTVTISHSLHHIEDLEGLFSEMTRVCKPEGLIVINEMISDEGALTQGNHMIYHHLISEIDNQLGHYHRDIYSRKELSAVISESSFQVVEQFVHEETAGTLTRQEDIGQLVASLNRRMDMLHNTEHYYFYGNKIREVIERLEKEGFQKLKEMAYILRPRKPGEEAV